MTLYFNSEFTVYSNSLGMAVMERLHLLVVHTQLSQRKLAILFFFFSMKKAGLFYFSCYELFNVLKVLLF